MHQRDVTLVPFQAQGVLDRFADVALAAVLAHGLDPDAGSFRDLPLAEFAVGRDDHLIEMLAQLLADRIVRFPLNSHIDVFRVFSVHNHVQILRTFVRAGRAFVVAAGPDTAVEVENLSQGDIQRADPTTHWGGEGPLDRHTEAANRFQGVFRKVLIGAVEVAGFITGIDLEPLDRLFAVVRLSHSRIEHLLGGRPDVYSGAVAANERNDRIVPHHGVAVFEADWGAVQRGGELLKLSHGGVAAWRRFGFGELMTRRVLS